MNLLCLLFLLSLPACADDMSLRVALGWVEECAAAAGVLWSQLR